MQGNTAVYLQYAHARICSIIQKANKDIEELKTKASITFVHADERALGLHVIRFQEVVEQACADLLPHYLCDYLYSLSEAFSKFYASCQVTFYLTSLLFRSPRLYGLSVLHQMLIQLSVPPLC